MPTPPPILERRYGVGGAPLPRRWASRPAPGVRVDRAKKPFDFSAAMAGLIGDIAARVPLFSAIDPGRIFVGFTSGRNRTRFGLQARVTPMRFRDGALFARRRGTLYQVQRYYRDGREVLYLVEFTLPRFLELPFEEKLVTVFHELYHVGPKFDGDVRRHGGRYQYHTHSQKEYDAEMGRLVREYLAAGDPAGAAAFLHPTYADLWDRHGGIYGIRLPRPKMVPVRM